VDIRRVSSSSDGCLLPVHDEQAILTDFEEILSATEMLELNVSLQLLFRGKSSAFFLGLEIISYYFW